MDMTKAKEPTPQTRGFNHQQEAAAAKVWAIYISEAEKYDRALVESWKSDMEGLLIFAALFSAVLTAFIIESYKSLNPDSGDLTVQLLEQISQQLATSANGSTFPIPRSPSFAPLASSLICNGVWFASLGLSLACALIATFVQQWARDFLHRTDMRSAPMNRAHIFSYLYYGLRRFQMHTVVETIPLLLHGSLLLFFSGLVAFLVPVNIAMTIIAATILAIVTTVYCILTLLPLRYLECPYRTPLSNLFWRIWRGLPSRQLEAEADVESGAFHDSGAVQPPPVPKETMVEAIIRTALEPSSDLSARDRNALVWTMKSLTDDDELFQFVDAIPDLGPQYRRCIRSLARHPDVQLVNRIKSLLESCSYGAWAPSDHFGRRFIACYKALWAIASLSDRVHSNTEALNFENVLTSTFFVAPNSDLAVYFTSAWAMMEWSTFLAVKGRMIEARKYLVTCEADELKGKHDSPELEDVYDVLRNIGIAFIQLSLPSTGGPHTILSLRSLIDIYLSEIPLRIFMEFLSRASSLDSPPYRLEETISAIQVSGPIPSSLKATFESRAYAILSDQIPRLNAASDRAEVAWIDRCITELLCLLQSVDYGRTPAAITLLFNARSSDEAFADLFLRDNIEIQLWKSCVRTLQDGPKDSVEVREEFTALWRLASIGLHYDVLRDFPARYACRESALKAFLTTQSSFPFPLVTYSIVALLKVHTLRFGRPSAIEGVLPWFDRDIFPADTAIPLPDEPLSDKGPDLDRLVDHRVSEACLNLVVDYLEHCVFGALPYNAVQTLDKMIDRGVGTCNTLIHPTHQMRLANSIHRVFTDGQTTDLLDAIVNWRCWSLYTDVNTEHEVRAHRETLRSSEPWSVEPLLPWLDNPTARQKIGDAFRGYEQRFSSDTDSVHDIVPRLRKILQGFDRWHGVLEDTDTAGMR
ncbi:hypothetical protein C8R44DRAFT_733222 [Mycena epipterygia]|nr:hypothetical protein C8R44DRAFT_733222 [Mycena epipterygia]